MPGVCILRGVIYVMWFIDVRKPWNYWNIPGRRFLAAPVQASRAKKKAEITQTIWEEEEKQQTLIEKMKIIRKENIQESIVMLNMFKELDLKK